MLTSIRETFSKGIARIILIGLVGLLIISFAIWGIQDVFRGFRSTEVARIGDTKIEADVFQRQYNRQVQTFSRQINQPINSETARQLGIDKQVLGRLVTNAALDERAKAYGLGLPLEKVATLVQQDPTFFAGGTSFNRNYFNAVIRDAGLSEQGFFIEQRAAYKRGQIGEAIGGEPAVPLAMLEAFARYGAETRSISYVTLTPAQIGTVADPDAATLAAFFEERKSDFRAPEYRKFTYMALSPAMIAAKTVVSDEDAKAEYEARIDRFTTPEKRQVQQIAFANDAEAQAASDRIKSGAITFDALAVERKVSPSDLDLGEVTKSAMLDPTVAEAVFKLNANEISAPIKGNLSTVIARVVKIDPAKVTPFEAAKEDVRKALATDRAKRDILDVQGKIEDARAGGQTLKELAPTFGLTAVEVAASDATGLDEKELPVAIPTAKAQVLQTVFATEAGVEADVVDAREDGFVWVEVAGVTPGRDRTLDEAKAKATEAWKRLETDKRLRAKGDELLVAMRGGKSIEDVAKELSLEVKQAWNLKRNEASQGLSAEAVNTVFSTQKDGFAQAAAVTTGERILFKMSEALVPAFDPKSPAVEDLRKSLAQQFGQDVLNQYVLRSQNDLGLVVNQPLIDRAIGIQN